MKIDLSVRQVAELAKLSLLPEEEARMAQDMADILRFAQEMAKADLTDVPPSAHVIPLQNVFREDVILPSMDRDTLLRTAPSHTDGCITVPKTFDEAGADA